MIRAAGFEIVMAEHLPQPLWDAYYDLMRPAMADTRPESAVDLTLSEEIQFYDRIGRDWWRYAVFVARKPA